MARYSPLHTTQKNEAGVTGTKQNIVGVPPAGWLPPNFTYACQQRRPKPKNLSHAKAPRAQRQEKTKYIISRRVYRVRREETNTGFRSQVSGL